MEQVEKGWNSTKNIQTDQCGPFVRPRMSKMWPQGPLVALFCHFWSPRANFFIILTWKKDPSVCPDVPCCVSTLFHPFWPKKKLWVDLCGQITIFSLFWPLLRLEYPGCNDFVTCRTKLGRTPMSSDMPWLKYFERILAYQASNSE